MVLNSIEKLLEKYDNGETSLKEEQILKEYFAKDDVPEHLESYRMMFQYFRTTKQELYTKDVPLKPKRNNLYRWISIAAVAVLMMGYVFIQNNGSTSNEVVMTPEQELIYFQTKEALAMMSSTFNKGAAGMNALNIASNNFEKGAQQMNYVSEFSKQTNKILKNK